MAASTPITVAHGDGIGPEIMAATLNILKGAGARLDIETIEIGSSTTSNQVNALVDRVSGLGLEIAMTVNLRNYDGQPGYTLAQGQ
jgi:isocitrate/isopropylmalate dehydrogenase